MCLSPQVEAPSRQAVGCFLKHCEWNSTFEALTFGIPMKRMPQWIDQPTNAKYVEDIGRSELGLGMVTMGLLVDKR